MIVYFIFFALALSTRIRYTDALNNGASSSPILGWTTGERYPCLVDCANYPDDCISEHLVKMMADFLSMSNFQEVGYEYIVIGDCWMDEERDEKGRLRLDRKRFPKGIIDLVNYIHEKNLKIGLTIDLGTKTCAGYPGSSGKYHLDAKTLADWDVDMVLTSACGFDQYYYLPNAYVDFGRELLRSKRPILYACDWPVKSVQKGYGHPNYDLVAQTCNSFRITQPIQSFETLMKTVTEVKSTSYLFQNFIGKGSFVDLDELVIGGYSLSEDMEKLQMAFWAMTSSPLLIASDLISMRSSSKHILLNKAIIDINQDPLGALAEEKINKNSVYVWTKPVMPTGSYAVAFLSINIVGLPTSISEELRNFGVTGSQRYNVTELFSGQHYGVYESWYHFNCEVEPLSALVFKFFPI